ncbi:wd40 repeat-containing protein [Blastocystis sp. subtype 4]|uniref:wd40 repeat-containing protein n=1 Tax=Blastocystis sp. subtype 4 TaxID=944170 RepID=UPI000711C381|nr:wd40 repeat-containing protein [Blastocystis sp. subtype 4]KNB45393.1 wd40 repeat-containing protein [Blastocystis sp. subtype 4]|eukprot:XP_014528836.1 wd40 repeat-containing protein [Blastocystis sp. subtype 4]
MVPSHIGYYHKCDIIACIFTSNDQYTITCDEEGFIRLINTGTGACERLLITRARVTRLITVRKDTLLVYGTEDGYIGVYQVQIGKILSFTKQFNSAITGLEAFHDDCVVTSSLDGTVCIYKVTESNTLVESGLFKSARPVHTLLDCSHNRLLMFVHPQSSSFICESCSNDI